MPKLAEKYFLTVYTYEEINKDCTISDRYATVNLEESLTQQSDMEETDINVIMEKYRVTGQVPGVVQPAMYGDFSGNLSYRDAVERVKEANDAWAEIPAKIRRRFANDPQEFMNFVNDPENLPEMRKMGLAKPEPIVQNTPAPAPTPEPTKEPVK